MTNPKIYHDNRFEDATPVASTTASGDYHVLNTRDWRPYTWWKPSAMPATITVDCGSSRAADSWGLFGHDCFTRGNTAQLRKSTDNFAANDVLVDELTPTSDDPFVRSFVSASSRYWRLRFVTGTAPSIAIAFAGAALELPTGLSDFDPLGFEKKGQYNRSVEGQPLGEVIDYRLWQEEIKLELVTWAWLRDTFNPAYEAHLEHTPFIFQWAPDDYPAELYLAKAGNKKGEKHKSGRLADLQFTLTAAVR